MRINQKAVDAFAEWSGDCNPVHVDPAAARTTAFGGTIVHGALSTIAALTEAQRNHTDFRRVGLLEINFRGAVHPDCDYGVETVRKNEDLEVQVRTGAHTQLSIAITAVGADVNPRELSPATWIEKALRSSDSCDQARQPANWQPADFRAGDQLLGVHRFGEHSAAADSPLTTMQEKVLGLCSFIVGMKAPGLSSLFTRLKVHYDSGSEASAEALAYRLIFVAYDPHFRLLQTEVEVATLEGQVVARAELQSYVRFPQTQPDVAAYQQSLTPAALRALQGKIALVCGASRGLGAELAGALGAAKCHVYLACRHPDAHTQALAESIRQAGGGATIAAGDVGQSQWCQQASARILEAHGRLDLLILNACAPPNLAQLSATAAADSTAYITKNITLTQTPLIHFLPLVAAAEGAVVAISSSAVDETPAGFADYVAVKMAVEGAVKIAARENGSTKFVIARPPKLRTSWSDSPLRAMGAIPPAAVASRVLEAIAQPNEPSNLQLLTSFPYVEPKSESLRRPADLELTLCASFTLDPIRQGLERWSRELDVRIEAQLAPYAQVLQELLNPTSSLSRSSGGSVVLIRLSDWLRELPDHRRAKTAEVESWLRSTAAEHMRALRKHREFAHGPTLLLLCPSTTDQVLTAAIAQNIESSIVADLTGVPGLTVLEARNYHPVYDVPEDAIHDALRDEIAHIPYRLGYYHFLSTLIVRAYHRSLTAPKKVVVLDCDNTLWSGVVGEVGPEGIVFQAVHQRLHHRLAQLAESGVLLCLCSKNEPSDIDAVFQSRADFGLRREQIVASVINWQPKSENIRSLAEMLNLGIDSFIFLDDNPVECAEVRSSCPSVLTVQWPHDPQAAARLLDHLWELDVYATTAEDRHRTRMYREELQRQETQQQSASFQDFIDSLQLDIQLLPLSEGELVRAAQLTLRTNQFNFTTIRRSESELRTLMADPRCECRTVTVSDRFGDYGLVGFLIGEAADGVLNVDTFLLSCRVLGRGVEHRMAAELGRIAQARNLSKVRWRHLPTERNAPARNFLDYIAAEPLATDRSCACEYLADASGLLELRFEASQAEASSEETAKPKSSPARPVQSTRKREWQIEHVIANLSSYAQLNEALESNANLPAVAQADDVAEAVKKVFAQALRLPVAEIARIDRLDALGCDSLQIVEITVALTQQFPWLPKTLLFEHRSVSAIIAQIVALSGSDGKSDSDGKGVPSSANPAAAATRVSRRQSDLAIVGIGVHCAGGKSPQELWEFLAEGRSAIAQVPAERDSFVRQLSDSRTHYAGLLQDVGDFDPEFFGISPREAEYMDPQLRLLLQTAWHALEDAGGQGEAFDPATGIFVGVMYASYGHFANAVGSQKGSVYRCWEGFSLPNRLSQVLGCYGPSLSVDTACSSSATALHYACQSLRAGDCTTAVVSGVNLIIDPERLVQFGRLGILSASGHCVPFGAGADGTVMGEGVVSVVLRPVEEARRRGDRIYALIKGTGLSVGAGSVGFTAPNPNAQAQAIRNAISASGIDPRTVSYVETHGTGTELGDPIEVRGLELAYCDRSLWHSNLQLEPTCTIGSIKPNIGHLEAGAGLTGVAKAALQLYHRRLLPSLTSEAPNPQIHFEKLPFDIQRTFSEWRPLVALSEDGMVTLPRRAGVNSFGVGGSNVHVILEEAVELPPAATPEKDRSAHLLTLSAVSEPALRLQASAWQRFLADGTPERLGDACYSANVGRKHHPVRAAVVLPALADARDTLDRLADELASQQAFEPSDSGLADLDAPRALKTAFLFTGQGAQYPGMLRQLHEESPVFREAFDRCARYLDTLLPQSLATTVFSGTPDDREHAIHQTGYTQPALFTIQYALFQLWKSWGIVGDILMGHSIGEVAAYCAAGGCGLEDALQLVAARGRLMQALPAGGAMCSIGLDRESVGRTIDELAASVSIAAVNGPDQTVISGPRAAVALVAERLEAQQGVKTTQLSVSHAFHSALMEPMLGEFEKVLRTLDLGVPQIPIVSSATGHAIGEAMGKPEYWLEQARNAVLFTEAMAALQQQKVTHYVELGPHPVMLSMGRQCIADAGVQWLPSARRGQDDWSVILDSLCKLYVSGAEVDWRGFDAPYRRQRTSVPGYQFDTRRIWLEELQIGGRAQPAAIVSAPAAAATAAERKGPCAYYIDWIESNLVAAAQNGEVKNGRWLLLSARLPTTRALADALAAHGIACIRAELALEPGLSRPHANGRTARPSSAGRGPASVDDRVTLTSQAELEEFLGRDQFTRIVWVDQPDKVACGAVAPARAASDNAQAIYDTAVTKVFELSQVLSAVSRSPSAGARCLWAVTSHAIAADHESALAMSSAPLWGFARVAVLECEALWGGIIDLDDPQTQSARLIDEIRAPSEDDQIAFRQSRRLVPRLKRRNGRTVSEQPQDARPDSQQSGLGHALDLADGTILITGGLGGIGIHLAEWLVEQGARQLLLSSRTGVASPEAAQAIDALRKRGVGVSVVAADVSTRDGIEACFQALGHTPLIGVIHAAGIDLQLPIAGTSRKHVEELLAAKVKGAWLLHEACQGLELQMFVCISSMASVIGSSDRSLYAAANAFLDALAHYRRDGGLPGLALNFGPWTGGGMADAQSLAQLEKIGNHGLVPAQALEVVARLLREQATQAMVADIDWQRFRPVFESRRPKPLLGDLGREAPASTGEPSRRASAASLPWVESLRSLTEPERPGQLMKLLQDEFAHTLRLSNARAISPDRSLFQMGLDSITAVEFSIKLQRQTGLQTSSLLVGAPTIRRLTETLLPQLNDVLARPSSDSDRAGAADQKQGVAGSLLAEGLRTEQTTAPASLHPDIAGVSEAMEPEVVEFCKASWPDRRPDLIANRWKWMFLQSAKRLDVAPRVWLFRAEGRIIGHMGAQFFRLKVGSQEQTTAWLVDTMVLESHRDQGIGARLLLQAQEDMPFSLSLGQTAQARTILKAMDWKYIAPLQTYVLPLNAHRVLQDKLPSSVVPAVSTLLKLRGSTRRLLTAHSAASATIHQLERFSARHDALWRDVSTCYGCATVRDASYLNWKYVEQPGQDYVRLEVRRADELVGCVVLLLAEPNGVYPHRRAYIVDLITSTDTSHLHSTLRAAVQYCEDLNVDAVVMHVINRPIERALKNLGFLRRSPTRHLMISGSQSAESPSLDPARLLDPTQWLITHGDSDIDRP